MKKNSDNSGLSLTIVSNALTGGGAEISMYALHKSFLDAGLSSNLIALNKSEKTLIGQDVILLDRNWRAGILSTIRNFLQFKMSIQTLDTDFLILNCELPELYGSFTKFKGKIICVEHTTKPWNRMIILGLLVRTILRFKKSVWITVVKNQYEVWFGGQVFKYIPNPFVQQTIEVSKVISPTSLTYIGGLKDNKRPEWVINAGIELNLPVYIFGDGLLKKSLESKYKNHPHQIKFFGFHANPWGQMPINSLVVVPSKYEGDGMVVIEAVLFNSPLLLADNEDLRRFNLGDKHYFNGYEELLEMIKVNIHNEFEDLKVSNQIREDLKNERSLKSVTGIWIDTLKLLKSKSVS